jgi:NADH-quinone oxidoreductase subunit M
MTLPLLSVLVWLPILGGIVVLLIGSGARVELGKQVALGASVLTFILSIPLYTGFVTGTPAMQFVERVPWITRFSVDYALGVDGISLPLILLTTFLTPIVVIAGWQVIKMRPAQYFAAFLIL